MFYASQMPSQMQTKPFGGLSQLPNQQQLPPNQQTLQQQQQLNPGASTMLQSQQQKFQQETFLVMSLKKQLRDQKQEL